jgi:hypothetical protein
MWNVQAPVQAGVFLYDTTQLKTMTQQHPITPPPELVRQWLEEADTFRFLLKQVHQYVAERAAQWGADQELEACCEEFSRFWDEMELVTLDDVLKRLRAARRPKPPSLKEQALEELEHVPVDPEGGITYSGLDLIRRALEAIPDD